MTQAAIAFVNDPNTESIERLLSVELRDFCRVHLPEVMIPSRFMVMSALPKLPNGKVDRKSLPKITALESVNAQRKLPVTSEEKQIAQIWKDLLSIDEVGVEDSFFDLGGDSISVVQMIAKVRKLFDVPISLRKVFKVPTISSLTAHIAGKQNVKVVGGLQNLTDEEMLLESQLPDDIGAEANAVPARDKNFNHILLTGGTGYTGAFLLRELIDQSDARIWVIVRAANQDEALQRILANLDQYGLLQTGDEHRIYGIPGDLGKPYLGVNHQTYAELSQHIEMIVHNAAISSYAMPYKQLKPTNVLGTLEVLRLAGRVKVKPIHYISSLSVFPGHKGETIYPEEPLEKPDGLVGGYRQTKWVSDRLIHLAGQRGIPYNIYRPGQITGAQNTGACSTDTYLNAAIKSCIQLKSELDFDVMLEISPVDFCAKSVAHIALSGQHRNQIFHITDSPPVPWHEVIKMLRIYGYSIEPTSYQEWYRRLASSLEAGKGNALSKFFPLFGEETPSKDAGDEGSYPIYKNDRLKKALSGSGVECKPLDQQLMNRYLDYFVDTGYLARPDQ
jgi:thioester reductase-like protein